MAYDNLMRCVDPSIGDDKLLFVCLDLEREGEGEEERWIFDGMPINFFLILWAT
jgi:hypothetical protein